MKKVSIITAVTAILLTSPLLAGSGGGKIPPKPPVSNFMCSIGFCSQTDQNVSGGGKIPPKLPEYKISNYSYIAHIGNGDGIRPPKNGE